MVDREQSIETLTEHLAQTVSFGDAGKARTLAKELIAEGVDGLYDFAYQLYQNGQYGSAENFFRLLTALQPHNRGVWMGLASAQKMGKKYTEALDSFCIMALLDTSDPTPFFYAACCCFSLNQRERALQAIDAAEDAARGKPHFTKLMNQLALMRQAWCDNKHHSSPNDEKK